MVQVRVQVWVRVRVGYNLKCFPYYLHSEVYIAISDPPIIGYDQLTVNISTQSLYIHDIEPKLKI